MKNAARGAPSAPRSAPGASPPSPGPPLSPPAAALAIPGARPCRARPAVPAAPPAPSNCPRAAAGRVRPGAPSGSGGAQGQRHPALRAGSSAPASSRPPRCPGARPGEGLSRGAPAALRCRTSAESPLLFRAVAAASPEPEPRGRSQVSRAPAPGPQGDAGPGGSGAEPPAAPGAAAVPGGGPARGEAGASRDGPSCSFVALSKVSWNRFSSRALRQRQDAFVLSCITLIIFWSDVELLLWLRSAFASLLRCTSDRVSSLVRARQKTVFSCGCWSSVSLAGSANAAPRSFMLFLQNCGLAVERPLEQETSNYRNSWAFFSMFSPLDLFSCRTSNV